MPNYNNFHIPYQVDKNADERAINMREIERVINGIITGEITIGSTPSDVAWVSWGPNVTASSGTITTATGSGKYVNLYGTIIWNAIINITTNGTGAGSLLIDLPLNCNPPGCIGVGKEYALTDDTVIVESNGPTEASIVFYNGNYPGADGAGIYLFGSYEAV